VTDSDLIHQAEQAWGGPVAASRHLGVSRESWQRWKAGKRPMPEYIRRSIEAHLACDAPNPTGLTTPVRPTT